VITDNVTNNITDIIAENMSVIADINITDIIVENMSVIADIITENMSVITDSVLVSTVTDSLDLLSAEPATCLAGGTPQIAIGVFWFLIIGVMFFAQHHVCDSYFVPAINVFVDKMKARGSRWGDEAVAGATICALGCNGPELFSNLVALYTGSDAGIGVVVGSEVFNLLIIVGATVLAAPSIPGMAKSLDLDRIPFIRDCLFYFSSIIMLYWVMQDKQVQLYEACVLLAAAVVYVIAVYCTEDIKNCLGSLKATEANAEAADNVDIEQPKSFAKIHGIEVEVQTIIHGSAMSHPVKQNVKIQAEEEGIVAMSTEVLTAPKVRDTGSIAMTFNTPDALLGAAIPYKDLLEVSVMGKDRQVMELHFKNMISLRVTCKEAGQVDELQKSIEAYSLGKELNHIHVHEYDASVVGACSHFVHAMKHGSVLTKLLAIPEFFIDFMLRFTMWMVDVKVPERAHRWPLCFLGAMCWLGAFSYGMLEIANQINCNIPALSTAFLGITVCALGTSFPNAVASILMAKQNKPAAAVANALGSNVQNVFLAMAVPWIIFMATQGIKAIPQEVDGIVEGVYWMMGTLFLLLLFVFTPPFFKLSSKHGVFLIAVYFVYVVSTSGEAFHWWPALVN